MKLQNDFKPNDFKPNKFSTVLEKRILTININLDKEVICLYRQFITYCETIFCACTEYFNLTNGSVASSSSN